MKVCIYQVDAFAERVFEGNPAAVCPLDAWIPDDLLQNIAAENNLSETAFFVRERDQFSLRWFTPEAEVDLCGHATLAAAHVLYEHLGYTLKTILFTTKSGPIEVTKVAPGYSISFPASMPKKVAAPAVLASALGVPTLTVLAAFDYVVVLEDESQVRKVEPDFNLLKSLDLRGVVVTAPGDIADFVSRCFYPKLGVDEDPVTGSAHCELMPYWANRLQSHNLTAKQLSRRGGSIVCELSEDRVVLCGGAVDFMRGEIAI